MGKSTAAAETIRQAVASGLICFAHDDSKAEPQVPDAPIRATPADLASKPLTEAEDVGVLNFRGDVYAGVVCEVEPVAALALAMARRRVRVLLYVDELDRAVTPGGRELCTESLRLCCTQGRAMGLCVLSGTQSPARAPKEVIDQATSVGFFRLGPRALNYLDDRLYLDRELLEVIPTLQVGEFVLFRPGTPWDRTIYSFPPPR